MSPDESKARGFAAPVLIVTVGDPYAIAELTLYGWQEYRNGNIARWGNVQADSKEQAMRAAERAARA